ncbi:PAAR domain-containing protein [Noviherbaspirillum malthae]|uniref:PAAR domain-containing protein n=1 Tax=Noviherbaspirillum malthae TaxID=1260987 RepID=UPI00188DE9C4|nr:PAAR domain-containing protein [Noviherbaspirillum malthae]
MSWLLRGLLIGAAIAVAGVVIAGTGGLAAAAIIGATAVAGAGLGELLSTMSWAPKEKCGFIFGTCSSNVFTNGIKAARAHLDVAQCSKHSLPHPPIATGSGTVFINGFPAARIEDSVACGAVITGGSHNVFIGGGVVQTDPIQPEDLVPGWVHAALFAVGLGAAIVLGGPIVAAVGTFGSLVGGEVGGKIGERFSGAGSDGQKWSMLAGSLAGGFLGVKGVPKGLEVQVIPGTLGANGANVKFSTKAGTPKHKSVAMDASYESEHLPNNSVWPGQQVKYLTQAELEKYRLKFVDGKAYDAHGRPFDTLSSATGKAIFVMDESGNIYASKAAKVGEFHHSSFLAGRPVAGAGELEAISGEITAISDSSGHYKPNARIMKQVVAELEERGVVTDYILLELRDY